MSPEETDNSAVTKAVIAALLACLLAGVGAWLTIGRQLVTRQEALEIVQTQSPYTMDREFLRKSVEQNRDTLSRLSQKIEIIGEKVTNIGAKLDILQTYLSTKDPNRDGR